MRHFKAILLAKPQRLNSPTSGAVCLLRLDLVGGRDDAVVGSHARRKLGTEMDEVGGSRTEPKV